MFEKELDGSLLNEKIHFDSVIESYEEAKQQEENKMSEAKINENSSIDWSLFTSNYVKLEEGEPIDLEVTNWRPTTEDFQGEKLDGIRFDVLGENGIKLKKSWVITSKRLIASLKNHIINAEKMGRPSFRIRVLKSGSGFNTNYGIKPLD